MAYDVGYRVDFRSGGDTVSEAFSKHISEFVRVYGILNELKDNDLTPEEIEELKYGTINGSRVTGTVEGNIDGSHVTGNIDGSKLSGEVEAGLIKGKLTKATIDSGKVNGLEDFVNEVIDGHGERADYGITESQLSANGYAKFGNGLMLQWGQMDISPNDHAGDVTFPVEFPTACLNVGLTASEGGVSIGGSPPVPTVSGFRVEIPAESITGAKIYYLAIGV